jgi:trehalose-phosphatase
VGSLWSEWPEVRRRIAAQGRVLFLLDFDGTLAPLAISPQRARISPAVRSLLADLAGRPRTKVAILSGRSLASIKSCVGLARLYYGGNHGLEIRGPGLSFRHPGAAAMRPILARLARTLRRDLGSAAGVLVEDKGLTLSVHYRRALPRRLPGLLGILKRLRARTTALPVRWSRGHKVFEIVPNVAWDKGAAALYLLERLRDPFPVALGDDRTDEDLFAAVRGKGLSVRIGRKGDTRAEYCLSGQSQVTRFLRTVGAAVRSTA